MENKLIVIDYTNWKGERRERSVIPVRMYWGQTEHHPRNQWLMEAWDVAKEAVRTFAMADIHSWEG